MDYYQYTNLKVLSTWPRTYILGKNNINNTCDNYLKNYYADFLWKFRVFLTIDYIIIVCYHHNCDFKMWSTKCPFICSEQHQIRSSTFEILTAIDVDIILTLQTMTPPMYAVCGKYSEGRFLTTLCNQLPPTTYVRCMRVWGFSSNNPLHSDSVVLPATYMTYP
jgi:hypothetical protein